MRILTVSGTYPPDIGGAELSLHQMLTLLREQGHEVRVVADERHPPRCVEGIDVSTTHPRNLEEVLNGIAHSFTPSVLFTQMIFAKEALSWAYTRCVPSVLFLRTANQGAFLGGLSAPSPDLVVANSGAVHRAVSRRWRGPCVVVHPVVRPPTRPVPMADRSFICFFNPVVSKGADRVRVLAASRPALRFIVVRSWTGLRDERGWNQTQWRRLAASQGLRKARPPQEVSFEDLTNVEVVDAIPDVDDRIYARTRVLLVPSRSESFGRVAVEALQRGIPVIASAIEGLIEALRGGGILISDGDDIGAWLEALDRLENEAVYRDSSRVALEAGRRYDNVGSIRVLLLRLEEILRA